MKRYDVFTTNRDFAIKMIASYTQKYKSVEIISSPIKYIAQVGEEERYCWVKPTENNLRCRKSDVAIIDIDTCPFKIIQYIKGFCIINGKSIITQSDVNDGSYDLDTLIDRLEKIRYLKGNITDIGYFDEKYGWRRINELYVNDEEKWLSLIS